MTMQLPPNYENCLAIGLCAAFEHLPSGLGGLFGRMRHMLVCSITFYPNDGLDRSTALKKRISFPLPENIDQVIPSHVWLIYLRREYFRTFIPMFHRTLEIKFDLQIDFKTEGTGCAHSNGLHEIEENELEYLSDYETEGTGSEHSNGSHKSEESELDSLNDYEGEGTGYEHSNGSRESEETELDFLNNYETEGTSYVHSNWLHEIEENGFDHHHQIDFKTEGAGYVHSNGLHEIEENEFDCQTEFKTEGTGFKINKCGVHFVFKQDIEDLSQTNEMDFFSDGEGSFSDGARPSGEGSSNGMTGTKRKRM